MHGDAGLFFEGRQVDVDGAFEAGIVEYHRVQRLGKRPDFFQRGLGHLLNLAQVLFVDAGFGRSTPLGARQHGSDGGENLAELVV